MAPYTRNINYLSVRLAACVPENGGRCSIPEEWGIPGWGDPTPNHTAFAWGAWPRQARPVLIMLHVTLLMIIWMHSTHSPPLRKIVVPPCSVVRSFPERWLTSHLENTETENRSGENSPSDVKIFATNVLVPTWKWWKSPPALFLRFTFPPCDSAVLSLFPTLVTRI